MALEVATIYVLTKAITDKRKNEIQYYFTLRVKTKSKGHFLSALALRLRIHEMQYFSIISGPKIKLVLTNHGRTSINQTGESSYAHR